MKKILILAIGVCVLAGCELASVGKKKQQESIEISQSTPVGTVYLFKTELDSNNVRAASQLLAHPSGKPYLAIEKYELYDEVSRIGRIISKKPVTLVKSDSLTEKSYKVSMELDYIKTISFTTERINDKWYIVNYVE